MRKKIGIFTFIAAFAVVALGFYVYWELDAELTPPNHKSVVNALPSSYDLNPVIAPYSGQHPANIKRPEETYSFPIPLGQTGPVEPLFAGPLEYPFLCMSEESGMGQPLVDNSEGAGVTVYELNDDGSKNESLIAGYSKDCSLPTQIIYYYQTSEDEAYKQLDAGLTPQDQPDALNWLRVEVGTINRFIYALLLPTTQADHPTSAVTEKWNKRLIYHFKGGISMGFKQGVMRLKHINKDMQTFLNQGYAVAYSTGNETSAHYNIWLAEDTALRVKKQFTSQYGDPDYTVGMGGSGGGLQQYLLAQNHPGIIDAGLALFSYPDMVTQIGYALDCELLEYYFDEIAGHNEDWNDHNKRQSVLGLTSTADIDNLYRQYKLIVDLYNLKWPDLPDGASTCTNGWRGSHASIHNPKYNGDYYRFSQDILNQVQFSHWNNLVQFYGTDDQGWANSLFDNQGVQYGLNALKEGEISVETFLHLNSHVGSWKQQSEMENEYYWHISGNGGLRGFKFWSEHNFNHEGLTIPLSKRSIANKKAIEAAYLSGHVYLGKLGIPLIDLRPYRDDMLDIHHSWSSFSTRLRMQEYGTDLGEQMIWTTRPPFEAHDEALAVIDQWMRNIQQNPDKSVADNRPADVYDRCYDTNGTLIHNGPDAWNGGWNNKQEGACAQVHPPKSSSRIQAGESYKSDILKCALQPIEQAIASGLYDPIDMKPHQQELTAIFPDGVCDYNQPGIGEPNIQL